jgi:hypothetical protein
VLICQTLIKLSYLILSYLSEMLEAPAEDPNVASNTNTSSAAMENEDPATQVDMET